MAIYAVTYGYTPDEEARDQLRPEHREYLAGQGGLLLSGPTDGDGALLIFEGKSAAEVEEILDEDPFWVEGLVAERTVLEWKPVLGPWRESLGL